MLYCTTVDMKVTPLKHIWLIKNQFCSKPQVVLFELFNNSFLVLNSGCFAFANLDFKIPELCYVYFCEAWWEIMTSLCS